MLVISLLAACQNAAPKDIEGQINSGDDIDGMVFQPIEKMDWDISLADLCDTANAQETTNSSEMSCYTAPGSDVFFGSCAGVWFDDLDEADKLWREFDMEATFDGQEINLPSFGYLDVELPASQKQYARIWNLMVENISTGTHIIVCSEIAEGEIVDTRTFNFTVSE